MRTEPQIEASRINGAKSRGPVTPEGKRNSSLNATSHALLSGTVVLKCESEDRFHELHCSLIEEFQPATGFEESLVENMAAARWRQMRVWGMEKANMDNAIRTQANFLHPEDDEAVRAALAFRALSNDNRSLDLIVRYEALYERQYLRAHRRLMEVQGGRTPPFAPAPAPRLAPVTRFPEAEPAPEEPDPECISAKRTQQVVENTDGPNPEPGENRPDANDAPENTTGLMTAPADPSVDASAKTTPLIAVCHEPELEDDCATIEIQTLVHRNHTRKVECPAEPGTL